MNFFSFNGALAAALFSIAGVFSGRTQSYSVDWHKVAGGGGTSTGDVYSVSGTIGQPDASVSMKGGDYSLTGGFWSIIAMQTPGFPLLAVASSGANVIVSWPSPSNGFVLQENPNVANTNGWSNYVGSVSSNATTLSVTISPPTGNAFFRLKQP